MVDGQLSRLGRRITLLREQAGWDAEEFARRAGFHVRYVETIEAGRRNMSLRNLSIVAATFNMTVCELLEPTLPPADADDDRHHHHGRRRTHDHQDNHTERDHHVGRTGRGGTGGSRRDDIT